MAIPTFSLWDSHAAIKVGVDGIRCDVVMVADFAIALLTPPFGVIVFVMVQVGELSFEKVVRCTAPFLVPLLIVLFLITLFPPIVTWLPNLVMGK